MPLSKNAPVIITAFILETRDSIMDEDLIRELRLHEIAESVTGEIEASMREQMAKEIAKVPDEDQTYLREIAKPLTPQAWRKRPTVTRGSWPMGVEHNSYARGDVLVNDAWTDKTSAPYLVVQRNAGDYFNKMIPFTINRETGVITPERAIGDYEASKRPVYIMREDVLVMMEHLESLIAKRPDPSVSASGLKPQNDS